MVASIESQLQHLLDDDDNSSLSDREERRLTRPQELHLAMVPRTGDIVLYVEEVLKRICLSYLKKTNCIMIWADGASFLSK